MSKFVIGKNLKDNSKVYINLDSLVKNRMLIQSSAGGLSAIYTFLLGSIVFPLTFGFTILIAMYNIYLELKNKKVD